MNEGDWAMMIRCGMHRWDIATHKCKRCGRSQPGFGVKRECTKPRSECQICEQQQAVNTDGTIGHHGYKRPGVGFIIGDCMGVAHKPYPETDALESYLQYLNSILTKTASNLADFENKTVDSLPFTYTTRIQNGRITERKENVVQVNRGDDRKRGEFPDFITVPSFDELAGRAIAGLEDKKARVEKEIERILGRIANAKNQ